MVRSTQYQKSVAPSSYDPFRPCLYAFTTAAKIAVRFVSNARSKLASLRSVFGRSRLSAS